MSKKITLTSSTKIVQVSTDNPLHPNGILYDAMVLNDNIPGPTIAVDQRDVLEISFTNGTDIIQSLVFDAGYGPSRALSGNVRPGESKTWDLIGNTPGVFLYYSLGDALFGMWEHVANGMYGATIVHSDDEKPAKEFCVVFSEVYNIADKGLFVGAEGATGSFDIGKFLNGQPDLHLTNGLAHRYLPGIGNEVKLPLNPNAEVFMVQPGELTRWYLLNAGPNEYVSFSFIGNISNVSRNPVTDSFTIPMNKGKPWSIPPGSGIVIETVFPEEGTYVGLDRTMTHFLKGAGFVVVATKDAKPNDHPKGSKVPPKGSSKALE